MIFPQFLLDLLYLPALPPIYVLFSFKTQEKEVETPTKPVKTQKQKSKQISKRPIRQKCQTKQNETKSQKKTLC